MLVSKNKRVLFISHDASQTGAPIVFLHLLRWVKANTNISITILLKNGGTLEADFNAIAPTYLWELPYTQAALLQRIVKNFYSAILPKKDRQAKLLKKFEDNFDLIYCNTVATHSLIPILKERLGVPIISHIHELKWVIDTYFKNDMQPKVVDMIDGFITVSQISKNNLINNFHINPSKIALFYEFINIGDINKLTISKAAIKQELGIENEFTVGGCGAMQWRKGIDLFIQLSWIIQKIAPSANISFVWVGKTEHEIIEGYNYECDLQNLKRTIIFTGTKTNPGNYFQVFDVFALTSREDPFPLVCLEAAALQKPIICFKDAGGIPEMIESSGGGITVPYHNLGTMASYIIEISNNIPLLNKLGVAASEAVKQYDVAITAPNIVNYMQQFYK